MRFIGIVVLVWLFFPNTTTVFAAQSNQFDHNGQNREYLLYRPQSLSKKTSSPLVIMLHGGFGSGQQAKRVYAWDKLADKGGFVVVYPDGINRSWNAGACCGPAARDKIDDVGFLNQLIKTLIQTENINPKRIYLAGISNGAALAYRYACEGNQPIAAIGSVSGGMSYPCAKPHATSLIHVHGMQDQHIPFEGGYGTEGTAKVSWMPILQTLDIFRTTNLCQQPMISQKSDTVKMTTSHCDKQRNVTLITINDAGHQWPGQSRGGRFASQVLQLVDLPSKDLDATSVLWEFFKLHPIP